jgi:integrase
MSSMPLSQAVEDYLAMRRGRYSQATVKNEGYVLRRFAANIGDLQMRNVTPEHVERWFAAMLVAHIDRSGVQRQPVQASSHNYYRARLKGFFGYCSNRGWTRAHLLTYVDPMPVARKIRQQPSPSHLWAMLDSDTEPRNRAILAVAMNTGLRSNEIAGLTVGDVDLQTLSLQACISKSHIEDAMPITADLAAELRVWLNEYAKSVGRPLLPADMLLPARTGPRYRWRTMPDGTREKYQTPSIYVPHRQVRKLHEIAQTAMRSVGLETKYEGIHTVRRAVARAYYDSLKTRGHEEAIRAVMVLLHHSNQSTTETYLGVSHERKARDESLRGRHLLPRPVVADVVDLTQRRAI